MSWRLVRLGDVVAIDSRTVAPESIGAGTIYIGLESIHADGEVDETVKVAAGDLKSAKFVYDERHVLFGKLRPNLGKVARPSSAGVCSTDILPLLPSEEIDRNYLAHFLLAPSSIALAASRASGANLPRLTGGVLKTFEIPLPPLPEQRRIASILDRAEALRELQRTALLRLDSFSETEVERAFHLETVGVVALRDLLTAIDSGVSPVCADRPPADDEWGVLKLGSISSGRYLPHGNAKALLPETEPDLRNVVKPGDILLSRKNTLELVGASVYVRETPDRLLLPDLIFRLVLSDGAQYSPRVLQRLLSTKTLRERLRGMAGGSAASMSNISKSRLLDLKVPRLSIDVQVRLERLLDAIDNLRAASTLNLAKLDELFASLQYQAFRGEL